jgi:hypothetical protein
LTQIHSSSSYYQVEGRPDLTKEIQADKNIPDDKNQIRVEHLKHFARWQRRLDKELGRTA